MNLLLTVNKKNDYLTYGKNGVKSFFLTEPTLLSQFITSYFCPEEAGTADAKRNRLFQHAKSLHPDRLKTITDYARVGVDKVYHDLTSLLRITNRPLLWAQYAILAGNVGRFIPNFRQRISEMTDVSSNTYNTTISDDDFKADFYNKFRTLTPTLRYQLSLLCLIKFLGFDIDENPELAEILSCYGNDIKNVFFQGNEFAPNREAVSLLVKSILDKTTNDQKHKNTKIKQSVIEFLANYTHANKNQFIEFCQFIDENFRTIYSEFDHQDLRFIRKTIVQLAVSFFQEINSDEIQLIAKVIILL